jgi:predicted dehydrogenase
MALRVAMVGAGRVSNAHLRAIGGTEAVEVVGLLDLNQALARDQAEKNRIPRVYASWEELLKDDGPHCVATLLPHDLHEQYATEALSAGKHVVCEKPLAPTVAECDRMLAAAARAGRKLFPVHNRVYDLAIEKMHEIVHAGQIGEVVLAQTTGFEAPPTVQSWLATPRGGGGVLMSQAVHPMYALRYLLGDVARVSCLFGDRKVVNMTAEDTAVVLLKFASGIAAEMTCTFGIAHGPLDHSITFHGRDGYLNMSQRKLSAISPQLFGDKELHQIELPAADHAAGFRRMWEDYARGILDEAPTRQTGEDGKRAVEIVNAAYRSNETGKTIDLPLEV